MDIKGRWVLPWHHREHLTLGGKITALLQLCSALSAVASFFQNNNNAITLQENKLLIEL